MISRTFGTLLHLLGALLAMLAVAPEVRCAVVITEVQRLSTDRDPGLRVGDHIDGYRAQGESIAVNTALEFARFAVEVLPRGEVELYGSRRGKARNWRLGWGLVDVAVRSAHPAAGASELGRLDAHFAALSRAYLKKDYVAAESAYLAAATRVTKPELADWRSLLHLAGAQVAWEAYRWPSALQRAQAGRGDISTSLLDAALWDVEGRARIDLLRYPEAAIALRESNALRAKIVPGTALHARSLGQAAIALLLEANPAAALPITEQAIAMARNACGRCKELSYVLSARANALAALAKARIAVDSQADAVAILRELDPAERSLSSRLGQLCNYARKSGDIDRAELACREGLEQMLKDRAPPERIARLYNNLGQLAWLRGDLRSAEKVFSAADAIWHEIEPEGRDAANVISNLAKIAQYRGDLAAARRQYLRTVDLRQRLDPDGLTLAASYFNLASIDLDRGDVGEAERLLRRAEKIQRRINPQALSLGTTLTALGGLSARSGHFAKAEQRFTEALAILAQNAEGHYFLAPTALEYGRFFLSTGRAAEALAQFELARETNARLARSNLPEAEALHAIGEALIALGRIPEAALKLQQALRIRRAKAPDTQVVARTLFAIGRVAELQGETTAARAAYCSATEALDRAIAKAGTDDLDQIQFRSQFDHVYRTCLEAELAAGHPQRAFELLERSRVRGFLTAIEQRDLDFGRIAPPALVASLESNRHRYEAELGKLSELRSDAATRDEAEANLAQLRAERSALRKQLRREAPAVASLLAPRHLDVDAARRLLPPDAALISFAVGPRDSVAFVLRNNGDLAVRRLTLDRQGLTGAVARLRELIARRQDSELPALQAASAALYAQLFAPLEHDLAGARQLLISPDAALHALPFAALWDAENQRYLIERWPYAIVDSMSALAALDRRSEGYARQLLAVADPEPDATVSKLARALRFDDIAVALPALPGAQREALALARLFPNRSVLLLGADATESKVKTAAAKAELVHFAVHAILDPRRPLDSALVLRPSGEIDNGLLQVWEIFEQLTLHAQLVVLSGCETALGQDYANEGLMGFTRAFQFSGAQAVVASLWPVADASTAELMQRFYGERGRLRSESGALRAAMLAMIRTPEAETTGATRGAGGLVVQVPASAQARHPYFWAGFQLYGAAH